MRLIIFATFLRNNILTNFSCIIKLYLLRAIYWNFLFQIYYLSALCIFLVAVAIAAESGMVRRRLLFFVFLLLFEISYFQLVFKNTSSKISAVWVRFNFLLVIILFLFFFMFLSFSLFFHIFDCHIIIWLFICCLYTFFYVFFLNDTLLSQFGVFLRYLQFILINLNLAFSRSHLKLCPKKRLLLWRAIIWFFLFNIRLCYLNVFKRALKNRRLRILISCRKSQHIIYYIINLCIVLIII